MTPISRNNANCAKHDHATDQERARRLLRVLAAQVALDHQLIRAMSRRCEKGAADDARPEGVVLGQTEGEIEVLNSTTY